MKEIIVRERSKKKEAIYIIESKLEDIFLNLILLLPEKIIPMKLVEGYVYRRNTNLKTKQIKNAWRRVDLDVAKQIIKNTN